MSIKDWAKRQIENQALVLDIESTGGKFDDEMIELAIVDLSTLEVLFDSLIKPTTLLNFYAQQVHKITYPMLATAPYLDTISHKINKIVDGKTVITYNSVFDKRLFYQSYNKYNLQSPQMNWECLMRHCTKYFGICRKLDFICDEFDIEKGTHRAKSDAVAAAKIIGKLAKI